MQRFNWNVCSTCYTQIFFKIKKRNEWKKSLSQTFKLFHIKFFVIIIISIKYSRDCVCGYHSIRMSSPFYLNVCSTFFGCRFGAIFELCFLSLLPYIFHRIMRQGREHRVPVLARPVAERES